MRNVPDQTQFMSSILTASREQKGSATQPRRHGTGGRRGGKGKGEAATAAGQRTGLTNPGEGVFPPSDASSMPLASLPPAEVALTGCGGGGNNNNN